MPKQFQTFFSNRIEHLYTRLKGELFGQPSTPFARRLIIVPTSAMKSWLMFQMARDPDLGIATGIEISYLDPTINRLCQLMGLHPKQRSLLHVELALALEIEIRQIIQQKAKLSLQEQECWQPMLNYLKISSSVLTRKTQKRLTMLCETLATLFSKYGIYGGSMVSEWERNDNNAWQQLLWCRLFESQNAPWSYPCKEVSELLQQTIPLKEEHEIQVHLFSMSFISQLQHNLLMHISNAIPVNYYIHSPCHAFWSDLKSDRESHWLQSYWKRQGVSQAQQQDLENYLQDRNPLLANFGKLGREMARQIEESETTLFCEDYEVAGAIADYSQYESLQSETLVLSPTQNSLSLLEAVQADIVLLRTPDSNQKISISKESDSIQIHTAHSRMREIQILHDTLLEVISRHSKESVPMYPGEIIVMAPDISLYAPYIQAIFDCSESPFKTQIMDIAFTSQSPFVQAFLHLVSLPFSRWEASALLQLFDFSAFQNRHQLSREEINTIREWVKAAGIRWGEDPHHRNELLKRDHCRQGMVEDSPIGTWEYAIDCLISGLVLKSSTLNIDATQAPLLGKWISLLRSLREDLSCLVDSTELSLTEWAKYLRCLAENYLSSDDENSDLLFKQIDAFILAGQQLGVHPFPFSTIKHHLTTSLQKLEHHREHDLNAICFCSMLPMRAIPAQIIVMLGMEEGAFPRLQPNLSLNLLQEQKNADYCPSQSDYDRFLFLEALLSARRYLLIFYQRFSSTDGKEQPPSLLVTELMAYLDKFYTIDQKSPSKHCIRNHPKHSFDYTYFSPNEQNLKSYSQEYYQAAQAYYHAEKIASACFVPEFSVSTETLTSSNKTLSISLKELIACAKNPIKTYFNRTLGIYLNKEEDRIQKNEEEFHLSSLQSYILKKNALKMPLKSILQQAEKEGHLPIGAFKNVALDKLCSEIDLLHCNLSTLGVDRKQIFNITFSEQYQQPKQTSDGDWYLPPLKLSKGQITGTLKDISPQGLIAHIKDDKTEIVKSWPEFLVLNALVKQYALPIQNHLLLVKGAKGKIKEPFFDDPFPHLERYLDYYFVALKHVSPLLPEWVPHLMQDGSTLEAKMRDSLSNAFNRNYNDYLLWALQGKILPDSKTLLMHWQPRAQALFSDLYTSW